MDQMQIPREREPNTTPRTVKNENVKERVVFPTANNRWNLAQSRRSPCQIRSEFASFVVPPKPDTTIFLPGAERGRENQFISFLWPDVLKSGQGQSPCSL